MKKKIELDKDVKREIIYKIKEHYLKETGDEIGDLKALLMLDFILEEIGPAIYNIGVYDSYKYMEDRTLDLLSIQKF